MNKVIIADRYQVPLLDGKYQAEHKILKRKGMKVTQEYIDRLNDQNNGVLFILDEEATAKNQEQRDIKNGMRIDKKERRALDGGKVLDAIIDRAAGTVTTKVMEPKQENKPAKPKLADLREQYPLIKAASVDAFLKKIAELKTVKTEGERMTSAPDDDLL